MSEGVLGRRVSPSLDVGELFSTPGVGTAAGVNEGVTPPKEEISSSSVTCQADAL